jgi:hypothetical protein
MSLPPSNYNWRKCTIHHMDYILHYNIGGQYFSTFRSTIAKKLKKIKSPCNLDDDDDYFEPNLLQEFLNGDRFAYYDDRNALFIDRNPKYFNHILDFLRLAKDDNENEFDLPSNSKYLEDLYIEADYFRLDALKCLINPLFESNILSFRNSMSLIDTCGFKINQKWRLIYRGTKDGFDNVAFHSRCDDIPKTLLIVKTENLSIFGGYTDIEWESGDKLLKKDSSSFLFSFSSNNGDVKCIKLINNRNGSEIYCDSECGPAFGYNYKNKKHDLFISKNPHLDENSYCKIGCSYLIPFQINLRSSYDKKLLAGSYNFKIIEIEVFSKVSGS